MWYTGLAYLIVGAGYMAIFSIGQLASIAAVDHSQQAVVTSSTCEFLGGGITERQ